MKKEALDGVMSRIRLKEAGSKTSYHGIRLV